MTGPRQLPLGTSGQHHDFDRARLVLLELMAEDDADADADADANHKRTRDLDAQ